VSIQVFPSKKFERKGKGKSDDIWKFKVDALKDEN
jgi:hypothetical protein